VDGRGNLTEAFKLVDIEVGISNGFSGYGFREAKLIFEYSENRASGHE
jgi:hypothetical protein